MFLGIRFFCTNTHNLSLKIIYIISFNNSSTAFIVALGRTACFEGDTRSTASKRLYVNKPKCFLSRWIGKDIRGSIYFC